MYPLFFVEHKIKPPFLDTMSIQSNLDPDAAEFVPSGMPEKMQAMQMIYGFVDVFFESNKGEADNTFQKVIFP